MAYCSNCGAELKGGEKFCSVCGAAVDGNTQYSTRRQQEYVGTVRKCPSCGAEVSSLTAICPSCGHEFTTVKVSQALSEFTYHLEELDRNITNLPIDTEKRGWAKWGCLGRIGWCLLNLYTLCIPLVIYMLWPLFRTNGAPSLSREEKQKANYILTYQFPNDRGSVLDALLFIKSAVTNLSTERNTATNVYWMRVWGKKADELYGKATLLFPGDSIAKDTYKEIKSYVKKAKTIQIIRVSIACVIVAAFSTVVILWVKGVAKDAAAEIPTTPLVLPDSELGDLLPELENGVGKVDTNNEYYFSVTYYSVTDDGFEDYKQVCKDKGYTIESTSTASLYEAYDEEGHKVRATHSSSQLHVTVEPAMKMTNITWPNTEIAKLIPTPTSQYGWIDWSRDDGFFLYIGNTPMEDFDKYIDACIAAGFDSDMRRTEESYSAENDDGYSVWIQYQGFSTMSIRMNDP